MNLLDEMNRAIKESQPEPEVAVSQIKLPQVYYDGSSYYVPDNSGGWVTVDRQSLAQYLISLGFDPKKGDDEPQSQINAVIVRIQTEHNVDYCGPVAGYPAGLHRMNGHKILVTSSPSFIAPQPGEFPLLLQILTNLLGAAQLPYFYGWLKTAIEMYRSRIWRPGQVLALCGPVGSGKGLLRLLITCLLGGRVATPHSFMTGRTIFNSDMIGAETLAIEDQTESVDIRARRHFGAAIKNITVNRDQRCEGKGRDAVMVPPLWRLIVSMNDEAERVQVLPPLDGDIADKIMLFKVACHPMPMPTDTPEEWAAFEAALKAELPMLVRFLDGWEIPDQMRSSRYGVTHFHNRDIAAMLSSTAPETQLFEVIHEELFDNDAREDTWSGTAAQLEAILTDEGARFSSRTKKLLSYGNACGTYLGRLEKQGAGVASKTVNGITVWTVTKQIDIRAIEAQRPRRRRR